MPQEPAYATPIEGGKKQDIGATCLMCRKNPTIFVGNGLYENYCRFCQHKWIERQMDLSKKVSGR
jgi:hypothetical protein